MLRIFSLIAAKVVILQVARLLITVSIVSSKVARKKEPLTSSNLKTSLITTATSYVDNR